MKCYACGKEIKGDWVYRKYVDGKPEYFCEDCCAARIDERTYNGFEPLLKSWLKEVKNEQNV